ncbi:MAG TPA: tetratricopeptide repeat protein [Spongiibacteraceae bacterium]|nr:tetratricopeptide repeat protein [Spongiibacteraceae bacterium]
MSDTVDTPTPDALVDLGEEHHKEWRLQEAEACYRQALAIDPSHPGALYFLARIAYDDGRLAFAAQLIDELLRSEPNDAEAWHLLGMTANKEGDFPKTVECFIRALAIQPGYFLAHCSLASVVGVQDELGAALASFQRVIALKPASAEAHCAIGIILQAQGKLETALSSYRQAAHLKSDFGLAYERSGAISLSLKKWDEALINCDKAIALQSEYVEAHYLRGNALQAVGRLQEALISYDKVLSLSPYHPEAYFHRGEVLQGLDRLREAVVSYNKALALKADYPEAQSKRDAALQDFSRLNETQPTLNEKNRHEPIENVAANIAIDLGAPAHASVRNLPPPRIYKSPIPLGYESHYTGYQYAASRFAGANVIVINGRQVRIVDRVREPEIVVFENLLSDEECELLIALSQPRLERSTTIDPVKLTGFSVSSSRTSEGASFDRSENALVHTIETRLAALMNLPLEHGEVLHILRYTTGAQYLPHYDFFCPEYTSSAAHLQKAGHRVATLIMYLNDVESGGETIFPEIEFAVKPRKGGAVYFSYCDASEKLDRLTLHGGAPVTRGEKWIATKWIRQRPWQKVSLA